MFEQGNLKFSNRSLALISAETNFLTAQIQVEIDSSVHVNLNQHTAKDFEIGHLTHKVKKAKSRQCLFFSFQASW